MEPVETTLKIPVKDRTKEQHLMLIKKQFGGSVRKYLLSMGPFKKNDGQDNDY